MSLHRSGAPLMDPGLLLFGLFFVLLLCGVPIFTAVVVSALLFLWEYDLGIQVTAANVYANIVGRGT